MVAAVAEVEPEPHPLPKVAVRRQAAAEPLAARHPPKAEAAGRQPQRLLRPKAAEQR